MRLYSRIDDYLREKGLTFFFLETHGIIRGSPSPQYENISAGFMPLRCPGFRKGRGNVRAGVVILGWISRRFDYRDFYRDAGFDIDQDHIRAFLKPYGVKTYSGLKYYRITGKTDNKEAYVFQRAQMKAKKHANHFIMSREAQVGYLSEKFRIQPVITATYDAELFGHWWFEGVDWLEILLRQIDCRNRNFTTITRQNISGCRTASPVCRCVNHRYQAGGEGYHEVWLNDRNDHVYRHLLKATERMGDLAEKFPRTEGILRRALNQAAREILLAQHSDWTFMMKIAVLLIMHKIALQGTSADLRICMKRFCQGMFRRGD